MSAEAQHVFEKTINAYMGANWPIATCPLSTENDNLTARKPSATIGYRPAESDTFAYAWTRTTGFVFFRFREPVTTGTNTSIKDQVDAVRTAVKATSTVPDGDTFNTSRIRWRNDWITPVSPGEWLLQIRYEHDVFVTS